MHEPHAHAHTHTRTHACTYTGMHACLHRVLALTHCCTCTHKCMCTHMCIHTLAHVCTLAHARTDIHSRTNARAGLCPCYLRTNKFDSSAAHTWSVITLMLLAAVLDNMNSNLISRPSSCSHVFVHRVTFMHFAEVLDNMSSK